MATLNQIKQLAESDTPLLFFQCILPSGDTQYWSTHSITFAGQDYSARVLKHNLFELQLSADDAMDGLSQLSLTLANADSNLSELNAAIGFKGSQLTVWFAFADLPSGTITTESMVLFRGVAGDPDSITEQALTLSFINKLGLQRIPIPDVRIQRTCQWSFPANSEQRTEALDGGAAGRFSRFYRCGYSADIPGGVGNLNGGTAYTSCDKSRGQCVQRGMFDHDGRGNVTRRFGAFEFVPSAITVRTAGDKTSHVSPLIENSAKFNDPVPLVYGSGWLKAPIIFARNDGNLTHIEVLLGAGGMQGVLKTVVNDVEVPENVAGKDMTTTGWYQLITAGRRNGNFDFDFVDSLGNALGDPYGNLSVLLVVVPNRISSGKSLPNVEVLLQGLQLDSYQLDGSFSGTQYTNNPAWIILDILRRGGWLTAEINLASFSAAAAFCQELIATTDLNGNALQVPRYSCNLLLTKRQSAASVVRGIRVASSLMLRYGANGLLELAPETTIAAQQALLPDGSNSTDLLDGGWPAYEFSDGSAPFSGIARNADGSSSFRITSRSMAETSNRLSVEFQDETNEYQQDSLSLVNTDDSGLIGYEISSQSTALGIPNFSQATRVLLRQLDKSIKGNLFIQFVTSFRALKVRPGDIIAVTYLKEGFSRAAFRVVKILPGMNYQTVTLLAQIHNDDWYSDNPAVLMNAGRQPGTTIQVPRPLIGTVAHNDASGNLEFFDFALEEQIQASSDGSATDTLTVSFSQPNLPSHKLTNLPLVDLNPEFATIGGSIEGGTNLYYAVTGVDGTGNEGPLSFTVRAAVPGSSNSNQVTIGGLSFPKAASQFNVYRGTTPQQLYRINPAPLVIATQFTDIGAASLNIGPPDASFDHANFYYRYEIAGPFVADAFSSNPIGCSGLGATGINYGGMIARIVEGTGRGQERLISSNTETLLAVSSAWSTIPDTTSQFVIAEASWKFAAITASSPAKFELAYEPGTSIQISGRAANVNNQESSAELCPLTRWTLGGGRSDVGLAGAPNFVLSAPGAGALTVSQVGFSDLTNTSSVTSGTLQLFSWNELSDPSAYTLKSALDMITTQIEIGQTVSLAVGDVLQVGTELMNVLSTPDVNNTCLVKRGFLLSQVESHEAGDSVLLLNQYATIVPFARGFFQNRASQNFAQTINHPDCRVSAAQFYVTNSFGDGSTSAVCYLSPTQNGLRTLSGGQFSVQVGGFITTQRSATPPLLVEASHAVRDIRAVLSLAATGYAIVVDLLQDGSPYCTLTIHPGDNTSSVVDGLDLRPLKEGASITMNIAVNAASGSLVSPNPGMDLTVTIRL